MMMGIVAAVGFLIAVWPLPAPRFLLAVAILIGFILFVPDDQPAKPAPKARVTYQVMT